MATLTIRDPYGNTFPIDAYARPYWEGREGYTIEDPSEPEAPADSSSLDTTSPKPSKKAASRPASDVKEQVVE